MSSTHALSSCGLLAIAAVACTTGGGDQPELPPLNLEGARVLLGTDLGVEICAGTVAELDQQVEDVEQFLGVTLDGWAEIYLLGDEALVAELCGGTSRPGCYDPALDASIVREDAWRDHFQNQYAYHEVVHNIQYNTAIGWAPLIVTEGLAAALGNDPCRLPEPSMGPIQPLFELPDGAALLREEYSLGALFVQYLWDRYSVDAFVEFLSAIDYGAEQGQIAEAFTDACGEPLEVAFQEFEQNRPELVPNPGMCRGQLVGWHAGVWQATIQLDCASELTKNDFQFGADQRMVTALIDVPEDGEYAVEGSAGLRMALQSCFCEGPTVGVIETWTEPVIELVAGRYRLDLIAAAPADTGASAHAVSIRPAD